MSSSGTLATAEGSLDTNCGGVGWTLSDSERALTCAPWRCMLPLIDWPSVMLSDSSWDLWRRRPAAVGGARLIATDVATSVVVLHKKEEGLTRSITCTCTAVGSKVDVLCHVCVKMRTLVKSKKGGIKARSKTSVRLMKKRLERTRRKKRYSTLRGPYSHVFKIITLWSRSQPLNQDSADVERERKIAEREMEEKEEVSGSDNADTGSDEEEEAAAEAHSQLLSTITDLGRRRKRDQRSEATATVSQYQLPRQAGGKCSSFWTVCKR